MKRWMVAAASLLAVMGGIVGPSAARASSAAWYQIYQANASGFFDGIAAVNRGDIWAVAQTYNSAGQLTFTPLIRHFNGSSWQAVTIPNSSGFSSEWVSASAANDVWVGGLKSTSIASSVAHQWNGASWVNVPVPAETFLQGVVVFAWNNVWAFGTSGTVADSVFHWNGRRWVGYLSTTLNFLPQAISASAPNNIWVAGIEFSGTKQLAQAYRFDGKVWHGGIPHPVVASGPGVTAVSRSDVWIGYYTATAQYALHWDGQWHTVTPSNYAQVTDIVPDGQGGYWFGAQAILTGSTWTTEQLPSFGGAIGSVFPIPRSTSFLMAAGVQTGSSNTEMPTIFRFDL